MSYLLGIDLGTTYTAAAVLRRRGDAPEMVALGTQGASMPSVLLVGEDGSLLVGDAAERRAVAEPDRVAREFKRRIGDPTPVALGEHAFAAPELAAMLVGHVVRTVADREGGPAEQIAVTHPASWGAHKLELLGRALSDAGVGPVRFLPEPQAAAVCYAAAERVEPGSTIAVYDLGGGTFDAAVVRKDADGGFVLLGRPEGVEFLGGVDFDEVVFEHVRTGAPEAFAGLDESDPAVWAAVARLRRECREAKEALSADTDVSVPLWLEGGSGRHAGASGPAEVRLHRGEFEELISGRVEDSVTVLRRAVESAGLDPAQVSSVLLVGGSSRIPLVAQLVSEQMGRPVSVDADPKNAIAKGAALALLPAGSSWPAVRVPLQRDGEAPVPEHTGPREPVVAYGTAGSGTGPTVAVSPFRPAPATAWADPGDYPTEQLPVVAGHHAGAPLRPDAGGSLVTYDDRPSRGSDTRARLLIGAGGLMGALAILAAVLFWPASHSLEGASARSIVPDDATPPTATAPPVPAPVVESPVANPEPDRSQTPSAPRTGSRAATSAPIAPPAPGVAGPTVPPGPVQTGPPTGTPGGDAGNSGTTTPSNGGKDGTDDKGTKDKGDKGTEGKGDPDCTKSTTATPVPNCPTPTNP